MRVLERNKVERRLGVGVQVGSGWATYRSFIEKMRTEQRCEGGERTSHTDAGKLGQRKQPRPECVLF